MSITPVGIREIAEHIRDEAWLDMRVVDGDEFVTLERVQVSALIVSRLDDHIEVRQEWVNEGLIHEETFMVECDSIRWARPTGFDLANVKPHDIAIVFSSNAKIETVFGVICQVAGDRFGLTGAELKDRLKTESIAMAPKATIEMRHRVVLMLYELTDLDPVELCRMAGYASMQPLLTASAKYNATTNKQAVDALRADVEKVRHRCHDYEMGRKGNRTYSPL